MLVTAPVEYLKFPRSGKSDVTIRLTNAFHLPITYKVMLDFIYTILANSVLSINKFEYIKNTMHYNYYFKK